jgi:hypothetical protein
MQVAAKHVSSLAQIFSRKTKKDFLLIDRFM